MIKRNFEKKTTLKLIPFDCLVEIFNFVEKNQLLQLRLVSKEFSEVFLRVKSVFHFIVFIRTFRDLKKKNTINLKEIDQVINLLNFLRLNLKHSELVKDLEESLKKKTPNGDLEETEKSKEVNRLSRNSKVKLLNFQYDQFVRWEKYINEGNSVITFGLEIHLDKTTERREACGCGSFTLYIYDSTNKESRYVLDREFESGNKMDDSDKGFSRYNASHLLTDLGDGKMKWKNDVELKEFENFRSALKIQHLNLQELFQFFYIGFNGLRNNNLEECLINDEDDTEIENMEKPESPFTLVYPEGYVQPENINQKW